MANYESNQGVTQLKVLFRANPLPVDSTEIWESLSEAQTYSQAANAYAGQTIKAKLEDGKYHQYILQPSDGGYQLEEVGANPSTLKQYVIVGARPGSGQEQGIIYIDNNVGYIWNGSCVLTPYEFGIENHPGIAGSVTIEKEEYNDMKFLDGSFEYTGVNKEIDLIEGQCIINDFGYFRDILFGYMEFVNNKESEE